MFDGTLKKYVYYVYMYMVHILLRFIVVWLQFILLISLQVA